VQLKTRDLQLFPTEVPEESELPTLGYHADHKDLRRLMPVINFLLRPSQRGFRGDTGPVLEGSRQENY